MTVELRDLLTQARLGLQLRACADARDTPLRWARIVEDHRDLEVCTGGELVLTRGRWRRTAADTDRFVCELAQRGAGALAAQRGPVLEELVAACERWRVPLLAVPAGVSVDEVAEAAITMALHRHNAGALRTQARHQALLGLIGGAADDVSRLLDQVAGDLACSVWLLTGASTIPARDGAQLSDADIAVLSSAVAEARGTVELVTDAGAPLSAFPLGPASGPPIAYIVAEVPTARLAPHDREALDQMRHVLERQLLIMRGARGARRRVGAEFVRRALSGEASGAELDAWARALDVATDGHVVCIVTQVAEGSAEEVERIADALDEMAELAQTPRVVTASDREVCALLFPGALTERVGRGVHRAALALAPALTRLGGAIGHSSVMAQGPADVLRMIHEARRVCQLNSLSDPEPSPVEQRPDAPLSALLLMANDEAMRSLHDLMLAPLLSYDAEHNSDLVHTLDVFLSKDGHWSAAAAELGVHVNTLRYRLARIEKCTGRDPSVMADRVDFYVALRAAPSSGRAPARSTARALLS
jgi:sugar diacid utilization regulator